jgi:RNA polymerase sigma-70 factor (ECF subfamily)
MPHTPEAVDQDSGSAETRRLFATTHWSVVLATGSADTTRAQEALNTLCRRYWYPLYAYVRRRGCSPEDAEDLTQEFFARLLRAESLADVTREGGRFRSFLLKSMNHFLTDNWRRSRAQKRGGGQVISFDAISAEARYTIEPEDVHTPESLYARTWALTLLGTVVQRVRDEYIRTGRSALFEQLKFCLTGQRSEIPYAQLARRLHVPENTVKTLVYRLRQRYRHLLREEIAQTVATPDEIEDELQALFRALAK